MDEPIGHVSDIMRSPVIRKIRHCQYRQLYLFCLVISLFFLGKAINASNVGISRYEFVSIVYERLFKQNITKEEIIKTGLLDQYSDGNYNLDWPVTRGVAAKALYRLSIQKGNKTKLPRAFADIDSTSDYSKPLEIVGGVFLPKSRGRFDSDSLLESVTLFRAINTIIAKKILKVVSPSDMPIITISEPVNSEKEYHKPRLEPFMRPSGFMEYPNKKLVQKNNFWEKAYDNKLPFTPNQINPMAMSNIDNAIKAVEDAEIILKQLGGSIIEMSDIYLENNNDEMALKKGFAQIDAILNTIRERFNYSKVQLRILIPVEPRQIMKCEQLDEHIDKQLMKIELLQKQIAIRLAKTSKQTASD